MEALEISLLLIHTRRGQCKVQGTIDCLPAQALWAAGVLGAIGIAATQVIGTPTLKMIQGTWYELYISRLQAVIHGCCRQTHPPHDVTSWRPAFSYSGRAACRTAPEP